MKFRYLFIAIASFLIISSCKGKKNIPDVSGIVVDLKVERFEADFYKIDTTQMVQSLDELNKKYQAFLPDYLYQVLGLIPQPDSVISQLKLFLRDSLYRTIYQDATKKFAGLNDIKTELIFGLQLTKHYFPKYNLPKKLITFVGPLDGVGTALTSDHSLAVGLQGYLGKDYDAYQNGYIAQTYPAYKSRRFEPQYIATNCIKNIIEELFPDKSNGRPLAERMIEQGRRLYVLDMLLPKTADSVKTGYTQSQLEQCFDNEKTIWAYFVQGNLLFEREPSVVSPYVTDGPKTPELSETSPGNIGTFSGWQIVKKWMEAHPKTSLDELMKTPTMTIFNDAGYKP
jgi:hypothetical protein